MSFINNANQIIGQNMTYLQQLQSNPQLLTGADTTTAATDPSAAEMQMMMPMLMMMMYQMMGQMSGQTSQNPYSLGQDPFMGMPTSMPFPTYQPPQGTSSGTSPTTDPACQGGTSSQGAAQWIQQNPAYQFLTSQLGGQTTTAADTATDPTSTGAPDFTDSSNLAGYMNSLFANNPDTNLQNLGNELLTGSTNGADPTTLKTQVQDEMSQQGYSTQDIEGFGVLYDAMQNNNNLTQTELASVQNTGTDYSSQIAQLGQNQTQYAQQWQDLYPTQTANVTTTTTGTSTDPQTLAQNVQQALANGQFTPTQLGQSLKYLLDNAPSSELSTISGVTSNLMKSGALNIIPFLHSNYLDRLTPDRQEALLGAVDNAGLSLSNGSPNSRFAGYLLENLSKPGTSSTQNFLQQFLQNEWLNNGQNTGTPEGQALSNVMNLAGLQGTVGQPLDLTTLQQDQGLI